MIKFALCSSWLSVETSALMDPHCVQSHHKCTTASMLLTKLKLIAKVKLILNVWEKGQTKHVDSNDSNGDLINLPTLPIQTSNVIRAFFWAGLFSFFSFHQTYREWWCDWVESRREDEGRKSPQYSCLITGGTPGHWKIR